MDDCRRENVEMIREMKTSHPMRNSAHDKVKNEDQPWKINWNL